MLFSRDVQSCVSTKITQPHAARTLTLLALLILEVRNFFEAFQRDVYGTEPD